MDIFVSIPDLERMRILYAQGHRRVGEATRIATEKSVLIVEQEAADRAPVDTGRLRNAITSSVVKDGLASYVGIIAITNLEYSIYQEYGTGLFTEYPGAARRAYPIRARNGRALAFRAQAGSRIRDQAPLFMVQRGRNIGRLVASRGASTMIFRRGVIHPGVHPRWYMRDGLQAALPRINRIYTDAYEQALEGL